MLLSHRFNEALSYAESLHREQKRKGTDIPYVSHLLIVSSLVLENGGSEDQAIAALLHDAVEDQGGESRLTEIREKYGESVAQIVADCTDAWVEPKPEWKERKVSYINSLQKKDASSLLVSLGFTDALKRFSNIQMNDDESMRYLQCLRTGWRKFCVLRT